jgi:DNA-binding transcriptional MerR regulator
MERDQLRHWLDEGLSLSAIGAIVERHPSTVAYWVQKHGLAANGRAKHAPRMGLSRAQLEPLVARGLTIRAISQSLGVSPSTVRHWMTKFGFSTKRSHRNRHIGGDLKPSRIVDDCPHHGETEFILEGRGAYRCRRCRSESVSRWRQRLKATLIADAGGACALCGYSRHPAALQFHHLDPSIKEFSLSHKGVTRSLVRARAEARKCILLCANCHAEVEAGAASLS